MAKKLGYAASTGILFLLGLGVEMTDWIPSWFAWVFWGVALVWLIWWLIWLKKERQVSAIYSASSSPARRTPIKLDEERIRFHALIVLAEQRRLGFIDPGLVRREAVRRWKKEVGIKDDDNEVPHQ